MLNRFGGAAVCHLKLPFFSPFHTYSTSFIRLFKALIKMEVSAAPPVSLPASPTSPGAVQAAPFPPSAEAQPAVAGSTAVVAQPGTAATTTTTAAGAVTSPGYAQSGMYGGMDPYGMGMMGGYGGLGMGGYGGMMGMGGYGGLGMMGMGGYGMGMMGMGMGMTPDAQRAQVMMFMMSRIVELWGMFSQVVQTTFGSVNQFVGNYTGISQNMAAIETECKNQQRTFATNEKERMAQLQGLPAELTAPPPRARVSSKAKRPAKPSQKSGILRTLLRHCIMLMLSMFLAQRIQGGLLK